MSRILGSLQVAVVLLPVFAGVLALGTFVESAYDSKVAQQLVYQTWWFVALLGLLALNIFCAAWKKRPWKRQQTGFLITHVGLLTLVAGGAATSVLDVHGVMMLIDSEDARYQQFGMPASNVILEPNRDLIRVQHPLLNGGEILSHAFEPGPLAWQRDERGNSAAPTFATGLNWLAHPWPRSWAVDVGRARLQVLDYYPHALQQPFTPAPAGERFSFPALAVELVSPTTGILPAAWVGFHGERRTFRRGPGLVELLGRSIRVEQLAEFRSPPTGAQAGKNGTLVLGLGGETFRWEVERLVGEKPQPLGKTGWSLRVTQYQPNFREPADPLPADPGLALELTGPGEKIRLALAARQAGELFPMGKEPFRSQALPDLWTWYHPPDFRYGDPSLKAVLQLVAGDDGAVHYRSFASAKTGEFQLEKAGSASVGKRERIWSGMGWKFQVSAHLPHALPGSHFIPVPRRLGQEDAETTPVIKCRLQIPGGNGRASKDFWLAKTNGDLTPIDVDGDTYLVGFNTSQAVLDFALRLVRAEQTTDNGTSLPASQTSLVLLTDARKDSHGETRMITLNQPLAHRGYRFYQAGYKSLGMDSQGRPVRRSVLKVQHDPGLWLKYAGSTMVALGITCMFYMRAYFFKLLANPSNQESGVRSQQP